MASTQTGESTAEQAKQRAQEATDQARGRVRDEVDRRSTEAGEQATSVADAIRQASRQLREQGKDQAAKPMEQAAQRVESAGQWLRDSDGDRILRDVEDFGRRNPLAVAAGGLAIGFALSRLLKASSTDRYRNSGTTGRGDYDYGGERAELPRSTPVRRGNGVGVPDVPASGGGFAPGGGTGA
jgi:hypothetical protein